MEPSIAITPCPNTAYWLSPTLQSPSAGMVYLTNSSSAYVNINKADHLADIRDSKYVDAQPSLPERKTKHDDTFQVKNFASSRDIKTDYLEQIQVDPDLVLTVE